MWHIYDIVYIMLHLALYLYDGLYKYNISCNTIYTRLETYISLYICHICIQCEMWYYMLCCTCRTCSSCATMQSLRPMLSRQRKRVGHTKDCWISSPSCSLPHMIWLPGPDTPRSLHLSMRSAMVRQFPDGKQTAGDATSEQQENGESDWWLYRENVILSNYGLGHVIENLSTRL